MTDPWQQQDALGFVRLVKRHFDRASISLPSEVWVRMNAILAGEGGQQSNPATLREALIKCQEWNHAHGNWSEDMERLVEAALAASGTEAASDCICSDDEHSPECPLAKAAASPEGDGREQRNWKGVRWADSVKASTLAEEIALHFAHDCNDSMCGEDADANNCEVAWIEDKQLTDFLNVQAALRQSAAPSGGDLDTPSGGGNYGDRIKEIVADWKSQIAMRADPRDYYQSGVRRGLAMAVSDVEGLNDAVAMTDEAPQQLQAESKTGAAPESCKTVRTEPGSGKPATATGGASAPYDPTVSLEGAAPSGGDLRDRLETALREAAAKVFADPIMKAVSWPETKERMGISHMFVLAGMETVAPLLESKTGAVTDAQAGRGQPVGSVGLDTQRSTVSGDSASIPESGETGAVTETK